ncbi:MAG TPA: hypothetical protein VK670_06225 [Silvibacterium sp.]|nr:hypothetical protein [Silvibacterium sp.]
MSDATVEASVPALVLVFPKRIDSDSIPCVPECEEEHEGNVFVGLKFAMIIYLILAVGIASAWKLCQLL